ncbi:sulfite exporter TauE/SafE family protein [Staphylococcus ratti]|uniref:Probable membrane transporter protein n=1 Tax=Staphylococcus ratti TaxID=2892440 RepID=A0ABY3PFJ7_9STAP|nr:TSUP family transporter [Staphylococcus ratti]UEX90964.1 TSUP family transporter [Staphylococcus ratti]
MELDITIILIAVAFAFLAAFIDAVVGGGGLILIPALLALGITPATALGTNKMASAAGSFTSALRFVRAKKVDLPIVSKLFPLSFLTAIGGTSLAVFLPAEVLKPIVILILAGVLCYTLLKKDWGATRTYTKLTTIKALLFVLLIMLIGFYDGFLGGGTGSFLMFALLIVGFDFLSAAGNAKVLNFASNLGALLMFMYLGHVDYILGFFLLISSIVGAYTGAQFAIRKGVSFVKVLFVCVTLVLILKNAFDYFKDFIL